MDPGDGQRDHGAAAAFDADPHLGARETLAHGDAAYCRDVALEADEVLRVAAAEEYDVLRRPGPRPLSPSQAPIKTAWMEVTSDHKDGPSDAAAIDWHMFLVALMPDHTLALYKDEDAYAHAPRGGTCQPRLRSPQNRQSGAAPKATGSRAPRRWRG